MKVHLIAACGVGMSALAGLLRAAGHEVTGSDEHVYPPASTLLAELGIPVLSGYDPGRSQASTWSYAATPCGGRTPKRRPQKRTGSE